MKIVLFDFENTLNSPRGGLYPDVREVLNTLRKNNTILGIITHTSRETLEELLESYGIKDYFDVLICAHDYDTLKPDPKLIKIALAHIKDKYKLKDLPKDIYYVGDRPDRDVRMAKLAGINAIRIIRGKYALKEPEDKYEVADKEIKSLKDLYEILDIEPDEEEPNKDVEIL